MTVYCVMGCQRRGATTRQQLRLGTMKEEQSKVLASFLRLSDECWVLQRQAVACVAKLDCSVHGVVHVFELSKYQDERIEENEGMFGLP